MWFRAMQAQTFVTMEYFGMWVSVQKTTFITFIEGKDLPTIGTCQRKWNDTTTLIAKHSRDFGPIDLVIGNLIMTYPACEKPFAGITFNFTLSQIMLTTVVNVC